jgi:hypothetical protein
LIDVPVWPRKTNTLYSSSRSVIIVQQAAQTLSPLDHTGHSHVARLGAEESMGQTLVMPFRVIMRHELGNGFPQRALAEQDQPVQAGFFDRAHESLGIGICMSLQMRRIGMLQGRWYKPNYSMTIAE